MIAGSQLAERQVEQTMFFIVCITLRIAWHEVSFPGSNHREIACRNRKPGRRWVMRMKPAFHYSMKASIGSFQFKACRVKAV